MQLDSLADLTIVERLNEHRWESYLGEGEVLSIYT